MVLEGERLEVRGLHRTFGSDARGSGGVHIGRQVKAGWKEEGRSNGLNLHCFKLRMATKNVVSAFDVLLSARGEGLWRAFQEEGSAEILSCKCPLIFFIFAFSICRPKR